MVKGRRKRAPSKNVVIAKVPFSEANDSIISPLKKEIRLEKNLVDEKKGMKTRNIVNSKSSITIASYFPLKEDVVRAQITTPKASAECNTADQVLFENGQDISVELEDETSIKDLFKTDETPVAVPCQNPSTPHRINMPTVQNGYTNLGKSFSTTNDGIKHPEPIDTAKQTLTKTGQNRTRGALKYSSPKQRSVSETVQANHKVTDYFPIRRSVRKSKKTVLEEKQRLIEMKVSSQSEDGLEVRHFVGKGRGVVTTREFIRGEFVVEYIGQLIDQVSAKKREAEYAKDQNTGCYMYYFQHRNQQYCVDATAETDKLGRLVNHSRNGNLVARVVEVEGIPHLVLTAKEDIPLGVELTYDYGDRSRESIRNHPWLAL